MLSIVAWALAHCNVCIDPQNLKSSEKPAILYLIFIIDSINKINILYSLFLFLFLLEVEVINFTNHKDPDSPS